MSQRVKYPSPSIGLPQPTKPFGSINLSRESKNSEVEVVAQIMIDRLVDENGNEIEGAAFGLAMDASQSMKALYGTPGVFKPTPNHVEDVVVSLIDFLSKYSGSGKVNFTFWSVGPGGSEVEPIGQVDNNDIQSKGIKIRPKKNMGGETMLMPVIRYFVDQEFKDEKWAMTIIVTDGKISDMQEVMQWTENYAKEVFNNKRKLVKLVLIGFGVEVDAAQLDKLDNFDASVDVDIWSAKIADDMEDLVEIFDEVMSGGVELASSGKVLDDKGNIVKAYNDGLPAKLEFKLGINTKSFTVEVSDSDPIVQDVSQAMAILR